MNPVRVVFDFGRGLELATVIACSRAPTVASWWYRDAFVALCRGGIS